MSNDAKATADSSLEGGGYCRPTQYVQHVAIKYRSSTTSIATLKCWLLSSIANTISPKYLIIKTAALSAQNIPYSIVCSTVAHFEGVERSMHSMYFQASLPSSVDQSSITVIISRLLAHQDEFHSPSSHSKTQAVFIKV